jgi:hypothetical protein
VAKAKPTDVTGRQREQLVKENAEALAARAAEMSIATAVENFRVETEVTDLTQPARPTTVIDEVQSVGVELADDTVVVRIAEDLDMMTYGVGNHYTFKAGQKYRVQKDIADHLAEKGYLYDRL